MRLSLADSALYAGKHRHRRHLSYRPVLTKFWLLVYPLLRRHTLDSFFDGRANATATWIPVLNAEFYSRLIVAISQIGAKLLDVSSFRMVVTVISSSTQCSKFTHSSLRLEDFSQKLISDNELVKHSFQDVIDDWKYRLVCIFSMIFGAAEASRPDTLTFKKKKKI